MKNSRKIVLITGCSTGIGRALAEEFARLGNIVYATARNPKSLSELQNSGIRPVKLDVNNAENIQQTVDLLTKEEGRLDILVNNAGYSAVGPLAELPLDALRQQFETNVFAPIALIQSLLPLLLKAPGAMIVNMGSISGILTTPFAGVYCASKSALHAFSDVLRMELAPFNIHVVMVQPGAIRSNLGDTATKGVSVNQKSNSLYKPIFAAIRERANVSQVNPTGTGEFAQKLVAKLNRKTPPAIIRLGKGGHAFPFLKRWVPTRLLDQILKKKFKLNEL